MIVLIDNEKMDNW